VSQYDLRARDTAFRLVSKYGRDVTYTRRASGAYDPATSAVAVTETAYPVKAYVSAPSQQQLSKGVLASSQIAYIPAKALAVDATPGDRVTDGGADYTVGMVDRITVGAVTALWIVEMKK
jgi:hypothetical protein